MAQRALLRNRMCRLHQRHRRRKWIVRPIPSANFTQRRPFPLWGLRARHSAPRTVWGCPARRRTSTFVVILAFMALPGCSTTNDHGASPPVHISGVSCTGYPMLPSVRPDAVTTGVRAGVKLASAGAMTVRSAGAVVRGQWIRGTLTVAANDVTVEDNKIEASASDWYGINIARGVTGTRIVYNEIWGDDGGYIGINAPNSGSASNYTLVCGNYLHNWENDLTIGPNVMVQANYIDAMQNHGSDYDADGIENYYGGNTRIWGNNIRAYGPDGQSTAGINSAVNITATGINIDDVQINGNWLGGGGTTLDLDQQQGATTTNIAVTGNVWNTNPPARYGPLGIHGSHMVSTWAHNTWSDGTPLDE